MMTLVFGTVLPWLLIALGAWLGYQLVRQNGRILLRLDSIETQLRPRGGARRGEADGPPVGAGPAGAAAGVPRPCRSARRRRILSCRPSGGYAASFPTSAASRCCSSSSIRA